MNSIFKPSSSTSVACVYTIELSDMFKFNGTPALIIGGKIIPGYIELSKLMEILLEEFPDNA